jgi:hypothetical protein
MPAGRNECHARKDGIQDKRKSRTETTEAMDLEANPEEIESELEHQKSLKGRGCSGNYQNTGGLIWGPESSCRPLLTGNKMDRG